MKVLNLYAGIGGNRSMWGVYGDDLYVTSVENNKEIAGVYEKIYPCDHIVVADAHQYLLDHYKEYDFIWSSPPCQTHSQYRHNVGVIGKGFKPVMPDMTLYAEIVFLKTYFKGKWVVENVKPYYTPLIEPSFILNRHFFWANFNVTEETFEPSEIRSKNKISDFGFSHFVVTSKIKNKRQVLRNCVDPKLGLHVFLHSQNKEDNKTIIQQRELFVPEAQK